MTDGAIHVRPATPDDVPAVCRFGLEVVEPHYAPLLGAAAARDQVRMWWDEATTSRAVAAGVMVVAEHGAGGPTDPTGPADIVGVGQRGRLGDEHVLWKLYVDPRHRGAGLGPRLITALEEQLPPDADRLMLEHFAANTRAGEFYEREGFRVVRTEPGPEGAPERAVVWRARPLRPARTHR